MNSGGKKEKAGLRIALFKMIQKRKDSQRLTFCYFSHGNPNFNQKGLSNAIQKPFDF